MLEHQYLWSWGCKPPRKKKRKNQKRHSAYFFIPHMLRSFDHAEIVAACIAPRPFLMISPTRDEDMPRAGVDDLISVVEPVYQSLGCPDHFKVHQPEGKHEYRSEYFDWMVAWFKQFLQNQEGRQHAQATHDLP